MTALNDRWRLREREYQPTPLCFILMDDKIVMGETRASKKKKVRGGKKSLLLMRKMRPRKQNRKEKKFYS